MITHYDLFAGIGGFSLALEEVFDEPIRHIFCEWERFPTSVLKQHWPEGEFWGDIAELVTHTQHKGLERSERAERTGYNGFTNRTGTNQTQNWTIVTGGFPCQPFSHAGRRKGTADDRYQWPNMYEVIRNVKPEWVIAENVRGLVTWNDGLVLETVCADLEAEGYEVQPFIIPAVAVNAPHRRDRVWIIGHSKHYGRYGTENRQSNTKGNDRKQAGEKQTFKSARPDLQGHRNAKIATDTRSQRRQKRSSEDIRSERLQSEQSNYQYPNWGRNWQEVAFATCDDSMDDGLPRLVDGVPYSRAKWRKDSLKAYGNGIVPQVAIEIMKAIKAQNENRTLQDL